FCAPLGRMMEPQYFLEVVTSKSRCGRFCPEGNQ
ncbi:hypothetical protein A2U01_0047411, partial [Trifolium medium]|nr:hypothetical protein [Trifolium medium]